MRHTRTIRIGTEEESLVKAAAQRAGDSVSSFVREAALDRAARVLMDEESERWSRERSRTRSGEMARAE